MTDKPDPVTPTEKQLDRANRFGWEYIGDGLFCKGNLIGWYHTGGFWKE